MMATVDVAVELTFLFSCVRKFVLSVRSVIFWQNAAVVQSAVGQVSHSEESSADIEDELGVTVVESSVEPMLLSLSSPQ